MREKYLKGVMSFNPKMKGVEQSTIKDDVVKYDGYISKYADYANNHLEGLVAKKGEFPIKKTDNSVEALDCVSIDALFGLPGEFHVDLVPRTANGNYYLDFVLYTNKIEKSKFDSIVGGNGLAKVDFGNDVATAIYDIFVKKLKIKDLTLMPIMEGDKDHIVSEKYGKILHRLLKYKHRLHLYSTSNISNNNSNGMSALIVHIPQDPYQAIPLIDKWFKEIKQLSNKQIQNS